MGCQFAWSASTAVLALVTGLASIGCKDDAASTEVSQKAIEASDQISQDEDDLLQRRDALLDSRRTLRQKREELAAERKRILESGGDLSEIGDKVDALAKQEQELGAAEDAFNRDLESLFAKQRELLASVASAGGEAAQLSAREGSLAGREKSLALREKRLAERESVLADRERKLAVRERETCAAPATTIIQAAPAKGARYTKRDVETVLRKARRQMSRKGILRSDLPPEAQGLERESAAAMTRGDYSRARFAADQLSETVARTKIGKSFIQAKISRLNRKMQGLELSGRIRQDVDDLFRRATANYGDGKFERANQRLNKIYSLIGTGG